MKKGGVRITSADGLVKRILLSGNLMLLNPENTKLGSHLAAMIRAKEVRWILLSMIKK